MKRVVIKLTICMLMLPIIVPNEVKSSEMKKIEVENRLEERSIIEMSGKKPAKVLNAQPRVCHTLANPTTEVRLNHFKPQFVEFANDFLQHEGVLQGQGEFIYQVSLKYDVNPVFMMALFIHESGHGSSPFARNYNNVGGFLKNGNRDTPFKFSSVSDSIEFGAALISNYYITDNDLFTITGIQAVYAPNGAKNDPKNLNSHWTSGVVKHYNRFMTKYYNKEMEECKDYNSEVLLAQVHQRRQ